VTGVCVLCEHCLVQSWRRDSQFLKHLGKSHVIFQRKLSFGSRLRSRVKIPGLPLGRRVLKFRLCRPFVGGQKCIHFVAPFLAPEIVQIFSFYVRKFWTACENRWQEGSLRQSQAVAGSRRQSQAVLLDVFCGRLG
jgi:hypothetical protein